jgi:FO synthase
VDDRGRAARSCRRRSPCRRRQNLSDDFASLLDAGIDDWGGVSPVTIDHVNPEAPWPRSRRCAPRARAAGLELAPRLTVYRASFGGEWLDPAVLPKALRASDSLGLAREDAWSAGETGRCRSS